MSQTATDNSYWLYPTATASTVPYTANNLDQYSAVGSVTPTYDGNGNLTFDGTFTYGYDAENRLISASGAGNTAAYAYDAQGRRKSKTVNGTTTIFVQDPQGRALLDYDGTSGTIQNWYAFGSGPNDALNQINVAGSTRATYIPDIQGSIVASLDASSGTLTKAGYQTYGESSVTSGTFRYTGARIDAETNGLYDFRARMYSPTLGRFMQTDPIGYSGGSNLYAYTDNDPLNKVDPSGLDALVIVGGERTDSWNFFGHVSIAVTGGGIFSFATGTTLGSSVSAFVNSQSAVRAQTMYTIKTTPQQDAQMLSFLQGQTDNIGLWDNCAARTCGALNAGGVLNSIMTAHTPEAVADQLATSGADFSTLNFNVKTSIPQSVTQQFEPPQPATQQQQSPGPDSGTLQPGGALQSPSSGAGSQQSSPK